MKELLDDVSITHLMLSHFYFHSGIIWVPTLPNAADSRDLNSNFNRPIPNCFNWYPFFYRSIQYCYSTISQLVAARCLSPGALPMMRGSMPWRLSSRRPNTLPRMPSVNTMRWLTCGCQWMLPVAIRLACRHFLNWHWCTNTDILKFKQQIAKECLK